MIRIASTLLILSTTLIDGQVLPPPINTNIVHKIYHSPPVKPITKIMLEWSADTNAYYRIDATTNLSSTNWYCKTNIPIYFTNVCIPIDTNIPQEYYKISAHYS